MSVKAGSFTPNATGNTSVANLTFLPTNIQFSLGAPTGTTDTTKIQHCRGWATASNQSYDALFQDSTGFYQQAGTDKCIRHFKRTSGTVGDAVAATFVSFDTNVPGSNYGFTINCSAFDTNYQIRYIARD